MIFNEKTYNQLVKKAKHQFILSDGKHIFYITLPKGTYNTTDKFVAHNETDGTVEIIDYSNITYAIIDGKKIEFEKK
ncbi:MAG: hypothetical protein C0594_07115 [Marinilabiliales bacterium]|nr:MAG: hypothetical protein C0594_07115 [Marinilabiliales bacterium]